MTNLNTLVWITSFAILVSVQIFFNHFHLLSAQNNARFHVDKKNGRTSPTNIQKLFPKNASNALIFSKSGDGSEILSKFLATSSQVYFKDNLLDSENPYFKYGTTLEKLQDSETFMKWKYYIDWDFKQLYKKCDSLLPECFSKNSIISRTTKIKSLSQLPLFIKDDVDFKIIIVVRDPRAIATHMIQGREFGDYNLDKVCDQWNNFIRNKESLTNDRNIMILRFEDFMSSPEFWVLKVFEFLGLKWMERINNMSKRLDYKRIFDWVYNQDKNHTRLTWDEVDLIQRTCKLSMENFGYKTINYDQLRNLKMKEEANNFFDVVLPNNLIKRFNCTKCNWN